MKHPIEPIGILNNCDPGDEQPDEAHLELDETLDRLSEDLDNIHDY